MVELFKEIPMPIKEFIQNYINNCINTLDAPTCIDSVHEFANSCESEEERDFIDFYFNFRLEQIRNESIND